MIANTTKSTSSPSPPFSLAKRTCALSLTKPWNADTCTTILFVDEVHRWNKAQQDALLPHVEAGVVTLIGATTENPYYEVNKALISRSRVFNCEI
ncbi:MAG: hypothetical protein U0X92_00370 [Anaerolineales bacterium]